MGRDLLTFEAKHCLPFLMSAKKLVVVIVVVRMHQ